MKVSLLPINEDQVALLEEAKKTLWSVYHLTDREEHRNQALLIGGFQGDLTSPWLPGAYQYELPEKVPASDA